MRLDQLNIYLVSLTLNVCAVLISLYHQRTVWVFWFFFLVLFSGWFCLFWVFVLCFLLLFLFGSFAFILVFKKLQFSYITVVEVKGS